MLPNYPMIIEEIRQGKYIKLGEGSGRTVYDIGNDYVIKYGRNRKGLAQNQVEYDIYRMHRDSMLASVVGLSMYNQVLIMEKAKPYRSPIYLCQYFKISNIKELLNLPEVRNMIYEYQLVSADLVKLSSWGEARQRPVLIDYGFTTNVRQKYYNGIF